MERDCHDSVCGVECLLYSISVVNVNINVENTLVILEQLQDGYLMPAVAKCHNNFTIATEIFVDC